MRNKSRRGHRAFTIAVLVLAVMTANLISSMPAAARTLTIDDVLDLTRIDRVAPSPDGEWLAVVVQRPARPGEVYGRTYYELDPSRGDVLLISRRTGERRNITSGAPDAAGFWCATWSPDGSRLAMLSTRPEGAEPRGGDNVRLYVWDRDTGTLRRLDSAALMTQTMGGSPLYRVDIRGGGNDGTATHRCSDEENAPFAWLDNRRLLAVTLPAGAVSGLIDAPSRPMLHASSTLRRLRDGLEPTVTAVSSGVERSRRSEAVTTALLRMIDTGAESAVVVASVPIYPFRGALTLSISPGGRQIAVLATTGAIQPARDHTSPNRDDAWSVERRLGFVHLTPGAQLRWTRPPAGARYPLELFGWSPDGRRVALRARSASDTTVTPLFLASAEDLSVAGVGFDSISVEVPGAVSRRSGSRPALWVDDRRLLTREWSSPTSAPAQSPTPRADWWLIGPGINAVNVTATLPESALEFRRSSDGRFYTIAGARLLFLDPAAARLVPAPIALLPEGRIVWPANGRETPDIVVVTGPTNGDQRDYHRIPLRESRESAHHFTLPSGAELLDVDFSRRTALWRESTLRGLSLRETSLANGPSRELLKLNAHLADINWGRTMLIDYRSEDGQELHAAAILPPGYQAGRRYPLITWVYPGYHVNDLHDYFLDPYLPGIYNLQLYAARGYVVLIPSMPHTSSGQSVDFYRSLSNGVFPAIDRLIGLGIADPARLGVMGQSFGGYGVYGLVTQSNRFRAAVALAGITDLSSFYTQFDAAARGYPGIEHEKSYNWSLLETGPLRLGVPPYEDYGRYWSNSPLAFVDRVETPLLLIHGEQDARAPMSQAESFFYSLYRQGKTARLLRYWGENHGLSQSPANVRDILEEIHRWFGTYLNGEDSPIASDRAGATPVR